MTSKFVIPKLDYKEKYKMKLQENIVEMKKNMDSIDYIKKVKNFAEKFNIDEQKIIKKYKSDEVFSLFFVKDPLKQSFHEKTAATFIESLNIKLNINMFQNFQNLPTSGKDALYVSNGNVIDYNTRQGKSDGKSIDFYWEYQYKNKKVKFYASHKYTEVSGGSQDNQRNDVESFMEGARSNRSNNEMFYAITDGDYYTDILDDLNELHSNSHIKAITINHLAGDVARYIKTWLEKEFGCEVKNEIDKLNTIINNYNLQ